MVYIFGDIANEIVDSITTEATYGFATVNLLIFILLSLVTCSITFFIYLMYKYMRCFGAGPRYGYEHISETDRRWFVLAGETLQRAECVIGDRARTIARMTPGIKINEEGVFETLGAVPYVGMIGVVERLYSHAGILVVPPALRGDTLAKLHKQNAKR